MTTKPAFDRDRLRDRLSALAARGIFIGGSSWKYEGWLGQIYSRSRYQVRGRFSKKLFEETCLSEYATVFPGGLRRFFLLSIPGRCVLGEAVPPDSGDVPLGLQSPGADHGARMAGASALRRAGGPGQSRRFSMSTLLEQAFLRALEPYRKQVGVLIFEFGALRHGAAGANSSRRSMRFFARLPAGWKFAVEIRNAEFLRPDYFACLRAHGVTHVYNAWTRMPEIARADCDPGFAHGGV